MKIEYMKEALEEAKKAYNILEVPVGAIIVYDGKIIGRGYNKRETTNDPTAHAEIIAIKEASEYLGQWRLLNCTMYVTLEPCAMCAGAIVNSRIENLIIGTQDEKRGCCGTVENLVNHEKFNHRVNVEIGIMREECSSIISDFFRDLRKQKNI